MINTYQALKEQHQEVLIKLKKQFGLISLFRLITIILFVILTYKYFTTYETFYGIGAFLSISSFITLLRFHNKVQWKKQVRENLVKINADEIDYLNRTSIPFKDGIEHLDTKHFYSYDLDVFGPNSLFQNLNRTSTFIGSKKLSQLLLNLLPNQEIKRNQDAVKELSQELTWRQDISALTATINDKKENYDQLIEWSETESNPPSNSIRVIIFLFPFLLISTSIVTLFYPSAFLNYMIGSIFMANLSITLSQLSKIQNEIMGSEKIAPIINQYSLVLKLIENQDFKSEKLKSLKARITLENGFVSDKIKKLSTLFSSIEGVQNFAGATIFNGTCFYHVHTLFHLIKWKKTYSSHIKDWLDVIGEFESLNSLANLSYNNPSFVFPSLNDQLNLEMKDLGHPLISEDKRVCNDIVLNKNNFTILTGSNMSGKSTFLRTLGINMILSGTGSAICSSEANIHPLNVLVSMRQTDSLSDSESYFFAEIKRLKTILEALKGETCFVLLDEILRGTNSEDKQTGTIKFLEKIIAENAIGMLATHDLNVCETAKLYPNKLVNKHFEADITDNNLTFDYKLRDGVCRNKSATFLMEKMNII